MPFHVSHDTEYFVFPSLHAAGLVHGVFTRRGGVSPEPWHSLNAGSLVGDDPRRVAENLGRACRALEREPRSLQLVRQVHGKAVFLVDAPDADADDRTLEDRLDVSALPAADVILTAHPGSTLAMRFADCVPILLYDPVTGAGGIAHAGWRGTLLDVAGGAVAALQQRFGANPADLLAGIGPSICPDHYEVGPEVIAGARSVFGARSDQVIRSGNGRTAFDLWSANRLLLEDAGVGSIEMAGACTLEGPERWFSHRGEGGRTGRFAVLAGVPGA